MKRLYKSADYFESNSGDPIRSVIVETGEAVVVAWHLNPGQSIDAHIHPQGQDTWYVVEGEGMYQTDSSGSTQHLSAGDVVIAPTKCIHSVLNTGPRVLRIISVVSPASAGYERIETD